MSADPEPGGLCSCHTRAERPNVTNKQSIAPPGGRAPLLENIRKTKTARSPHAYVRGNTVRYYQWLDRVESGALPEGPAIWIRGDATSAILAQSETPGARCRFEFVISIRPSSGNPAHDLIRLSLSLASAARGSDLPGLTTVRMVERIMEDYRARSPTVSRRAATSKSPNRCGASRRRPPRRLGNRSPPRISKARAQLFPIGKCLEAHSRIPLRPFNRRRGSSAREANGDIGIKAINSRCVSDQGHILARHGLIGVAGRASLTPASPVSILDRQNYLRSGGPASWHPVRVLSVPTSSRASPV